MAALSDSFRYSGQRSRLYPARRLDCLSVYPRIPRWWAMCIAIIAGVTMSWAMESLVVLLTESGHLFTRPHHQ